jgi:RNA polymerase sigma-70 factor, ECF subfamily
LNLRPPGPQPGALPGCATPRRVPSIPGNRFAPSHVERGVSEVIAFHLPANLHHAYDGRVSTPPSDEALARRASAGDTAAFEQLVLRHQHKLYTLALRVTLNEADARDCVQEGLISAWRAMPRFRRDARFSTWMYRIVLRKAYDAIDRRRRTAEPVDEIEVVARDASVEQRMDLERALDALEPEFRAVAVACDVLGLPMDQAGELLGIPPGTVKSRLFRARARLAAILEPERSE